MIDCHGTLGSPLPSPTMPATECARMVNRMFRVGPGARYLEPRGEVGPRQSLDYLSADASTISYEMPTRLVARYHRTYRAPAHIQQARNV